MADPTCFGRVPHKMRGWTLDVYNQITHLPTEFSLQETYTFEEMLKHLHPENKHLKDKTRQQFYVLHGINLFGFVVIAPLMQ